MSWSGDTSFAGNTAENNGGRAEFPAKVVYSILSSPATLSTAPPVALALLPVNVQFEYVVGYRRDEYVSS